MLKKLKLFLAVLFKYYSQSKIIGCVYNSVRSSDKSFPFFIVFLWINKNMVAYFHKIVTNFY